MTTTTSVAFPTYTLDQLAKAKIGTDATSGNFVITGADGRASTLSFSELLLSMGMQSLDVTRNTFNTQYAIAQERVNSMKELNDLVQAMNLYKNDFKSDGKVTDAVKKRNGDLYKTLMSNLETTTKNGRTYFKDMDGNELGPIEHVFGKGDNVSKLTKKGFDDFLKSTQDLKYMLNEAELYIMLTDGKSSNRYMELALEVRAYRKQADNGMPPSVNDLSPPLTGDNLAFMQKIIPLLNEANSKQYGLISWDAEGKSANLVKTQEYTDADGKKHTYKSQVFAPDYHDGTDASRKAKSEFYTKLLNTPLKPDGYTLPDILKLHDEMANSSTLSCMSGTDIQKLRDFMDKHPGTLNIKIADIISFDNKELETFLSNCQTAQSTLSSLNEQQGMRTNQAMQRSSGMLETLQTLLQTAKQARDAAAGTGGA